MTEVRCRLNPVASLLVAVFMASWLLTPFLISRHEHVWCSEHHKFEHAHHHELDHDPRLNPTRHIEESLQSGIFISRPLHRHHSSHEACRALDQFNEKANRLGSLMECKSIGGSPLIRLIQEQDAFQRFPLFIFRRIILHPSFKRFLKKRTAPAVSVSIHFDGR